MNYKKLYVNNYCFGKENNVDGRNIMFCNISIYKNYSRYIHSKRALKKWVKESPNNRLILIYAMSVDLIYAATDLKEEFHDLKILQIVPDVPEHMSSNNSFLFTTYKKIMKHLLDKRIGDIDYFVLLSKYMTEKINVASRPWIVIEGIYNKEDLEIEENTNNNKVIFYAGSLARRYGIIMLLDAFSKIPNSNYRLMICGAGEAGDEIIERAKIDKRIIFPCQVDRKQVLQYEKQASLLVNPRPNDEEFTKYSFPSKTMEYLGSGVPALICKLQGIPDEYYKYCYSLDKMDVYSLKSKIEEILSKDNSELKLMGLNAEKFIMECKNANIQCAKIKDMVNNIKI